MLLTNISKAYFDRFIPRPKDGASSYNLRNNFAALASCDFLPLRATSSIIIESHDFGKDADAADTYSGTGVTVTSNWDDEHLGLACLQTLVDVTGNRQILRETLETALDLSDLTKLGVWHRCDVISSAIQFILRDSDGNESYWNITTNGTADTWEQAALTLASPDANNGTPADLTDIVSYGYKGLDASATYLFDEITAYVWAMKVYIQQSYIGDYFYPIYNGADRVKFEGGFTALITAPAANPRIDLISLNSGGSLVVTAGSEVASPDYDDIPECPEGNIPLYAIYLTVTATQIVEYHLKDNYPDDGYIFADLRPVINIEGEKIGTISVIIDGGGSAITTGKKAQVEISFACILSRYTMIADQAGTIVIDINRSIYSNFPTTASICGSGKECTIAATNQKSQDTDISNWTSVEIAAGDVLEFEVDSCTTITRCTLSLKYARS